MHLRDSRLSGSVCLLLVLSCATFACSTAGPLETAPDPAPAAVAAKEAALPVESERAVSSYRFAVIGDYGTSTSAERDVANLVKSWDTDTNPLHFIITMGDNNYGNLTPEGYLRSVCGPSSSDQYYGSFVRPADGICKQSGSSCSESGECCSLNCRHGRCTGDPVCSASVNRFFPTPGNHDWKSSGGNCPAGRDPGAPCSSDSECCSGRCITDSDTGTRKCGSSSQCQALGSGSKCCRSGTLYSAYAQFFPHAVADHGGFPLSGSDLYYDFDYSPPGGGAKIQLYAFNANCAPADEGGCHASHNHGCPRPGSGDCQEQYESQVARIRAKQRASTADWSLVYFHQPPYAISRHVGCEAIKALHFEDPSRFRDLNGRGLAAVLSGHAHNYESFTTRSHPDVPFFVVGSSGHNLDPCDLSKVTSDMASHYCAQTYGAMLVTVSRASMQLDFYEVDSHPPQILESCTITRAATGPGQCLSCRRRSDPEPPGPCPGMQSCSEIKDTDCGWCVDSGRAFLGTKNDGPAGTCCRNWIWDSDDCECAGITSCSGIRGTKCGWCVDTGSAAPGDEDDPTYLACRSWIWDSDDCGCAGITSCSDIRGTKCGWCVDTGSAAPGDRSGPEYPGLDCSNWIWHASDPICQAE